MVIAGNSNDFCLVTVIEMSIGSCTNVCMLSAVIVQNPVTARITHTPQNTRLNKDLLRRIYSGPLKDESSPNFVSRLIQCLELIVDLAALLSSLILVMESFL